MAGDHSDTLPVRTEDRFKLVLEMAFDSETLKTAVGEAAVNELKALISPANIGMTIGIFMVWAGSHAFGVGLIFDVIMLGLGAVMIGWSAWEAAEGIAGFIDKTVNARNMNDLKIASTMLAGVIAILGVKLFMRMLSKGAAGATSGGKSGKSKIHDKVEEAPKGGQKKAGGGGPKKQPAPTQKQAGRSEKAWRRREVD